MSVSLRTKCVSAVLANAAFACAGSAADPVPFSEPTRTHAIISVEQQRSTQTDSDTDTAIMFGLLRVPPTINSSRLLQLMGMGHSLPPTGNCEVLDSATLAAPALSNYEQVELLDVGDITVTSKGKNLRLSRQAFPTVTDFISGVLYTTRDSPSDFPFDANLVIRARGNATVPSFMVSTSPVEAPQQVTIDSTPIGELSRLNTLSSFEVRWTKGRTSDLVWLELGPIAGNRTLSCAFNDALGFGVVPGMLLNVTGESRLVFHRVSVQEVTVGAVDQAEVRFDVRLTQPVLLY